MRGHLLCSLLLGVVGCNADSEYSDALPSSDQVAIKVPQSAAQLNKMSASDGLGAQASALLGATSELYQITWGVSASVNTGTVLILGALHLIALQAPTSRTATSRTWGPYAPGGLDPMSYRMVVTKLADGHFGYSLDASSRLAADPSQFLPLVDGEVTRGVKPGTGKGTMVLHFDNRRQLVPEACEDGTLAFDFDTTSDPVRNDVTLHQFANANPKNALCNREKPVEAAYHFDQDSAGSGNFVFSFTKDMVQPAGQSVAADENVTIRSRWQGSGAGRSDILVEGADVDAALAAASLPGPVTASQCWDTRFQTVFEASSPAQLDMFPNDGVSSACAFTSAQLPN
jgi:hypothetical protein